MKQVLNIKIEEKLLKEIDKNLVKHRYSTRSEFVRESIRDKLSELEKVDIFRNMDVVFGSSKHKTSDEALHKAMEKLARIYEERFK